MNVLAATCGVVPIVDIADLDLRIDNRALLGKRLSLQVPEGSRVGIAGPSGCGKTTLLRSIAAGSPPPGSTFQSFAVATTRVGYAPQRGGLFPWYTLDRNLQFFRAKAKGDTADPAEVLDVFGIAGAHDRFPAELSGGEAQRAILACALLSDPKILLVDEPLTGVDSARKWSILSWTTQYIKERGITLMVVSHDLEVLSFLTDLVYIFPSSPDRGPSIVADGTAHPRSWDQIGSGAPGSYRDRIMGAILDPTRIPTASIP